MTRAMLLSNVVAIAEQPPAEPWRDRASRPRPARRAVATADVGARSSSTASAEELGRGGAPLPLDHRRRCSTCVVLAIAAGRHRDRRPPATGAWASGWIGGALLVAAARPAGAAGADAGMLAVRHRLVDVRPARRASARPLIFLAGSIPDQPRSDPSTQHERPDASAAQPCGAASDEAELA